MCTCYCTVWCACAVPELSEEEKQEILMRDDFQRFLNKTCRLVERAIHEDDIFVDYTGETNDDQNRFVSGRPTLFLL